MRGHRIVSLLVVTVSTMAPFAARAGLSELLHRIDTDSPGIAAANARASAAVARLRAARSQYFGSAVLVGQGVKFNNRRLVAPISPPLDLANLNVDDSQLGVGLTLSLPLDINRRIGAAVAEQWRLSQAASHDAEQVRLFLFGRAVFFYRALQELQGNRNALQSQLLALEKNYQVSQTRVDVGRASEVELLRIDAERRAVVGQLAAIDGRETSIRSALAALLGQQDFRDAIDPINAVPRELSVSEASDTLQRPDIKAGEERVAAARERLNRARRDWFPNMRLQAGRLRNAGVSTRHEDTWSLMLRLNWELWDGGRRTATIEGAKAGLSALDWDLTSLQLQANQELRSAIASWRAARLQYDSAVAGLSAATETEKIQSERFQAGRLSVADLVDATATLAKAMATKTSAMARWWLADDQARLAVGLVPNAYSEAAPIR